MSNNVRNKTFCTWYIGLIHKFNFNLSLYFSLYTGAVKEVDAAEDPGNPKAIGGILIIESVRIP